MKRIICIILMITLIFSNCVCGTENKDEKQDKISAKSYVLMEASSGKIIKSQNETQKLSPASITKIMTLILIFDEIHSGKLKLSDVATTSAYAKSMGGSQVFLEEGEQQTVETLIKCIIIASGNDASVTMAEHISGSEEQFVKRMNKRAKKLKMNDTNFKDCCGLTDSDEHYTSAKDVAIMSRELITKYPEIFKYSTIWMEPFTHKTDKGEKEFMLSNTNKLLKTNKYVKGLKTGSTSKAKYCVSTVATKDNVTMIAVIMAASDYKARFQMAEQLIKYGFSNCKVYKDNDNKKISINILNGEKEKISVKNDGFSYVDTNNKDLSKVRKKVFFNKKNTAPIDKGQVVGNVKYYIGSKMIGESKIRAVEKVEKANYRFTFLKMLKAFVQLT